MILLNAVVVAAISCSLLLFVAWLSTRLIVSRVDDAVIAELDILSAEYRLDQIPGVTGLIEQRIALDIDGHYLYLLLSKDRQKLAGNLGTWPNARRDIAGWMVLSHPMRNGSARVRALTTSFDDGSVLLVGIDDHEVTDVRNSIANAAGFGILATLLLAAFSGYVTSRVPLRQIEAINRTAESIIDGHLAQRVPLRGSGDEFDRLGGTINAMLDRMTDLMQGVRSATDSIAHDLRTPLARLKQQVETARGETAQREIPVVTLDRLAAEVDRVLAVFGSLLRLATIESGTLRRGFRRVELLPLLHHAVQFYEPLATERGIVIALPTAAPRSVDGDRDLLFQAICNLLDNAIKFSPEGGAVSIDLIDAGRLLQVVVRDSGPGIPDAERERVFDRLVRLDASRNTPGFGLGLSLVRAIARLHRGEARVLPGGDGARVALELPLLP